jgi:hypothetical protein
MTDSNENNPVNRTGPVPGEDDVDHARRLRADGFKVVDIAKALNVSERQVYRLLATGNERIQIRDMEPWSISTAIEDGDTPEAIRYLFETNENVHWRRGAAKYAWVLNRLKTNLAPELVSAYAEIYVNVARRSGRDREVWSRILDLALITEPWATTKKRDRFFDQLHVRNESDLEFAAQVFNYLNGTANNWGGIFRVADPVPDQAGWLRSRVTEIEREEKREPGTARLIVTPGDREPPKKGKS